MNLKIVHHHFEVLDSTNNWAKTHAEQLPCEQLTLVTADVQTHGRGQFNRVWFSPPHQNIYASYHFCLPHYSEEVAHIAQLLALSTAKLISQLTLKPSLRWPNDLLVNGKKIGGVLAETLAFPGHLSAICGIGLNVNMTEENLHAIDQPATSILAEKKQYHSLSGLTLQLTDLFKKDLELFLVQGFSPFHAELERLISK